MGAEMSQADGETHGQTNGQDEANIRFSQFYERKIVRKADNLTTILCRCHVIWEP